MREEALARVDADPLSPIPAAQRDEPLTDVPDVAQARSYDLAWTIAALVESLVLVGGLLWIMSGDSSASLWRRVIVVTIIAAISAAGSALLIAARLRSGS